MSQKLIPLNKCAPITKCCSAPSDVDDLFDVMSELIEVVAHWKSIGIALRLKPAVLDSIQANNSSDPTTCLTLMVTEWLRRNYNVEKFGEPTWQRLVEAVGHPAGGADMALAMNIATKYKALGMCSRFVLSHSHFAQKQRS